MSHLAEGLHSKLVSKYKFMKRALLTFSLIFVLFAHSTAQDAFGSSIELIPLTIPEVPGIHSYAYGQHDGKWLVIGGRLDGLHRRQPFAAFPADQNNTDIYVIDPNTQQFWTASLDQLGVGLKEHLQSTNMNFTQVADTLYIAGGYGFASSADDHITQPKLATIIVSSTIDAVINGTSIAPLFNQITDDHFAVCGGHLAFLNGYFYLVGGHRFDGNYNPMGNPTYTQTYSNEIRKFKVSNSDLLSYTDYSALSDEVHLHRRDYNLLAQVFPDGTEGFTISSGVFQVDQDLPYLYPVDITETGYNPVTEFNQYLSNYHCGTAQLFDAANNQMHMLFFGGMSQFYSTNGTIIQDDLVPFVKTISRLSRFADGSLHEFQLPIEMPSLKGASAEFIINSEIAQLESGVILLNALEGESILLGHIYGGIQSSTLNPFNANQLTNTSADPTIYEVWLTPDQSNPIFEVEGTHELSVSVYPNPADHAITIAYELAEAAEVHYYVTNALGQIIQKGTFQDGVGAKTHLISLQHDLTSGMYQLTIVANDVYYATQKFHKK